ncbi:hypothetical protein BH24GEM2_BH24GEM2_08030 [soil metagenome]
MPVVTMDEARFDLGCIEPKLVRCVRTAWETFQFIIVEKHPTMRVRARRALAQDLVVGTIESEFGGTGGFQVIEPKCGRVLLVATNRLLLQFRMLDKNFRTRNNDTKAAGQFDLQRNIEGLPPLPRLTIGWRLNHLETGIEGIYVTFTYGDLIWYYRINENGGEEYGSETLNLLPSAPPPSGESTRRVGPKRPPADADEKVIPMRPNVQS